MLKGFLIALFVVVSGAAQADVAGTWAGVTEYSDSDGVTASCETANTFDIQGDVLTYTQVLTGQCDWYYDTAMTVNGSDLLVNGEKVGTISDNAIEFTVTGDYPYQVSMALIDDSTASFEDHSYYDDTYNDSLKGTLTRSKK